MFDIVFNTTFPTAVLTGLLTGVFLLLYGVRLVSDALERVINGRMQQALTRLFNSPFAAFGIGVVGTGLMQSSSAMASLLVRLVSAGLLPLSVAIVMVLGSNVGSTLVVQLLALHITDHAIELLGLGVVVALFTHSNTVIRRPGRALFAFGLIVLGLAVIGKASQPLAQSKVTIDVLTALSDASVVLVVIGAVLAMLLNSSTASIGLVLTLAAQGAIQSKAALALMLGANVGTTLLAMLSSLNEGTLAGRRLALVHTGTKLLGACLLLPLLGPLSALLSALFPNAGTEVALAHMGFNVALALIFVPLSGLLTRLMERLLPEKNHEMAVASVLDKQALATPAVAQGLATRETLRMADIVTDMLELGIRAFEEQPDAIQKRIRAMDDQVDELNAAIKGYLTQLDEEEMPEEQRRQDIALLTIVSDLEGIGDVITHRFMNLAHRQPYGQLMFSEEGKEDLVHYHKQIKDSLQHVMAALAAHDPVLANKCLARKEELKRLKRNLHLRHIRELRAGVRAGVVNNTESSAVYLDLLDALGAVLSHISNMAYALQESCNVPFTCPLPSQRTGQLTGQFKVPTQQLRSVVEGNLVNETGGLSCTSSFRSLRTGQWDQKGFTDTQQPYSVQQEGLAKGKYMTKR